MKETLKRQPTDRNLNAEHNPTMILIPATLMIVAAFWAVDKLARIQKDAQWRAWLDAHRPGIGPDGLDALGCKPRRVRCTKNVLLEKR